MVKILQPKVQATGLFEAFEMGVFKTLAERAMTPVIGNGTVKSGAIKLVAGGVLNSVSQNKHVKIASSAIIIDAVEDMAHTLVAMVTGGAEGTTGDSW